VDCVLPVFDADPLAKFRVEHRGDVAGREDIAGIGAQCAVDLDPVVHLETGQAGESIVRNGPDADDDSVDLKRRVVRQDRSPSYDAFQPGPGPQVDTVLAVFSGQVSAQLGPDRADQRLRSWFDEGTSSPN
jgi:hypothetical protein